MAKFLKARKMLAQVRIMCESNLITCWINWKTWNYWFRPRAPFI